MSRSIFRSLTITVSAGALLASLTSVAVFLSPVSAQTSGNNSQEPRNKQTRSSQGIDDDQSERRRRVDRRRGGGQFDRPWVGPREVRTYDGTSNNIANPTWGATFVQLQRFGDADFADGISSLAGALRPSARIVSNEIADQSEGESIPNDFGASDFMWQWGQFLDHDIDLTDGGTDEAADIPVPAGDPFFDPTGTGAVVIPFNRAHYDEATGTDLQNPRQQINEITAWIDASMIYGSNDERAAALRVGPDSPFLATSAENLLPFNTDGLGNANGFVQDPTTLFLAGDVRANEQLGLTVMHTLFVREHNRLAALVQEALPSATAEEVFQSARRLVAAEIQIITYKEFLPALLGRKAIPRYREYDPSINPSIFNEFSAAAYRLGHSMLSSEIERVAKAGNEIAEGDVALRNAFFSGPLYLQEEGDLDPILRGLATQTHQKIDAKIVNALRNFLFGEPGQGGLDLASLNIQRGRDHGLGSYNDTRVALGLAPAEDFTDVTSDLELQQALQATYENVDDIDLWIGGLAEDPLAEQGSQLGPLFREILIRQFTALRDGDRFWHKRDLTRFERNLVKNVSLAEVIRNNTGIGDEIPDNVFYINGAPAAQN